MTITTTDKNNVSYEEGIAHLKEFALRTFQGSFNYAMLFIEDDGSHTIYERVGMPCWGALREYHSGTSPTTDYWPGDLRTDRHIFPKTGHPVAVSTILTKAQYMAPAANAKAGICSYDDWNQFVEFVYNPEISPFKRALKGFELLKDANIYRGVIITDTNINPSDMLGLFRVNFNRNNTARNFAQVMKDNPGIDPRVAYLKASDIDQYYLSTKMNLKMWFTGEPRQLDEGHTYFSRMKYNRPEIEFIFDPKDKTTVSYQKLSIDELTKQLKLALA